MKTKILIALFVVLVAPSLVSAHSGADEYVPHGMMSCFYGGGMMGMNFFGWAFMILVVAALVLLIIWLIKQIENKPRRGRRK